jgi:chloramphenicol-sensitive protein RarD
MPLTHQNRGLVTLLLAFAIWGLFPIYWKTLVEVNAIEILQARLILTAIACLALLPLRGTFPDFIRIWKEQATLRIVLFAAVLLSANWFSFIWAVNSGNVLESSLGYFLCPIVNILFGWLLFKERLGMARWSAVFLALAGVGGMIFIAGRLPLAAIVIALTWSGYSVLKKKSRLGPVVALGLETSLLSPLAAAGLIWLIVSGGSTIPSAGAATLGSLVFCGILTATPLLLFAYAAPKVRMSTIGMAQYIVPSSHFLLALFYGERVDAAVLFSFSLIWAGLFLFSLAAKPDSSSRKAVDGILPE